MLSTGSFTSTTGETRHTTCSPSSEETALTMTTLQIQSDFDLPSSAAQNSEASRIFVQIEDANGVTRVVSRERPLAAAAGECQIFRITPVAAPNVVEDKFDDFAELARELAADAAAAEAVAAGRQWVAEKFGNGDLASLRLAAGLSQSQLAAACGIEQPHVSRYESGKTEPLMSICSRLASALGVSMEEFEQAWQVSRAAATKVTQ